MGQRWGGMGGQPRDFLRGRYPQQSTVWRAWRVVGHYLSPSPSTMRNAVHLLFLGLTTAASAQFGPSTSITRTASAPECIVVADLDGDGANDILVSAYASSQVVWYPGEGSGVFGEQRVLASDLLNATSCAAADLDGDGDLDVVAVGMGTDSVLWFRNDGAGNFGPKRVLSSAAGGSWGVHAADVDGDALVDILVCRSDNDRLTWYRNLGGSQFAEEVVISTAVNDPRMISSGDLDGDGDIDLVSASAGDNKVAWYPNQGDGTFAAQVVLSSTATWAVDAFAVDMDGDGDLDVLSANQTGNRIAWHANDGTGTFGTAQTVAITASTLRAAFPADLDGDGDTDVLSTSSTDDRVAWYANNGSGVFGAQQVISNLLDNPIFVVAGDVDGDGDPDVVASGNAADRLEYFANNGSGQFGGSYLVATSEASNPLQSRLVDINGDGALDVVVVSNGDGRISWYPNAGDGTMGAQQVVTAAPGMRFVEPADVDGDGDVDLFSINPPGSGFGLSINDGTGQFGPRVDLGDIGLLYAITTGDVNGDGHVDILFGVVDGTGLKVALNNGDGTFAIPDFDFNTTSERLVLLADIEDDGDLDAVIADPWADQYQWHANDGLGNFGSAQVIASLPVATVNKLFWKDMNGDGAKDLVSSTDQNDLIAYYPNLGGGSFGPEAVIATVNGPRGVDIADLDGDGDNDVAATSWFLGGGVFYALNAGGGVFDAPVLIDPSPYGPIHLVAGDLDGDGDPDLVVTSNLDDRSAWYENYFGSAYRMEGRLFHDLDANGVADEGEPGVAWAGVGTTPVSSTALSGLDGAFVIQADSGAYEVGALAPSPWWQVTTAPPTYTVQLTAAEPVAAGLDIGLVAAVDTSIIAASVHTMPGVCESEVLQYLVYTNRGTRIEQGRVTLDLDTLFTFNSAVPPPDVIDEDHYEWNFTDLGYEEVRTIVVNVTRPSAFFINDTLNADLHVLREDQLGTVTDTFSYAWAEEVLCSYDPNDKQVLPRGLGPLGVVDIATPHLDYTIRFQNTGNAPAVDVVLRDVLSDRLENSTIEVLGYSHEPTRITIGADAELTVEFRGINLPDSASSNALSQGFFSFRVRVADGSPSGTAIVNDAAIFFDLNEPVITNAVVNTLVDCSLHTASITDLGDGLLQASPGAGYQWLLNGSPIPDAVEATYQVVMPGDYSVRTTSAFYCEATSEAMFVTTTAVSEAQGAVIGVVPNPFKGITTVYVDRPLTTAASIEVVDATGRIAHRVQGLAGMQVPIHVGALTPGLYLLRVREAAGVIGAVRVVVE